MNPHLKCAHLSSLKITKEVVSVVQSVVDDLPVARSALATEDKRTGAVPTKKKNREEVQILQSFQECIATAKIHVHAFIWSFSFLFFFFFF